MQDKEFHFLEPTDDLINWISNLLILSIPDKGYSWNVWCTLNWISTYFS